MTKKTAAQVVLDHLDEIEHKISMGIYQTAILADLSEAGHEMTLGTFRKSLARARSKKESRQEENPPLKNPSPRLAWNPSNTKRINAT